MIRTPRIPREIHTANCNSLLHEVRLGDLKSFKAVVVHLPKGPAIPKKSVGLEHLLSLELLGRDEVEHGDVEGGCTANERSHILALLDVVEK